MGVEPLFVIRDKKGVLDSRFLLHYMSSRHFQSIIESNHTNGTIKHLTQRLLVNFTIPVPPLPVQREIVRILDTFTAMNANLEEELTARRKQYDYCKDNVIPFDDHSVEWRKMGEISTIARGASPRPIKSYLTDANDGVNWIKIGDVTPESKYIVSTGEKITHEGAAQSRFVHAGDFLLSNSMSFGRPYILKIDGCIHDGWLSISDFSDFVTSDFLYHVLTSNRIQKDIRQMVPIGGAVSNLNADIVRNLKIPVPNLSAQKRIVEILDCFSELCSDGKYGIQTELALRRKQYEYYRDKLLAFKEA